MLYFSYGTDLSLHAVLDFCRAHQRPVPRRLDVRPAVLLNHRIQFSRHDSFFGGGVADAVAETGKSVSGALMTISELGLDTLRRLSGASRATTVKVVPLTGGPPLEVAAFLEGRHNQSHIPPTSTYLTRLMNAAAEIGLSTMWIMQLRTFASIDAPEQNSALRLELSDGPRGLPPRKSIIAPAPVRPSIPWGSAHELVNC